MVCDLGFYLLSEGEAFLMCFNFVMTIAQWQKENNYFYTWEAEAGRSLLVQGQPELHSDILSQKPKKQTKTLPLPFHVFPLNW